jgi:formate-dependent nitrite reductase cytochrome c552 subunit
MRSRAVLFGLALALASTFAVAYDFLGPESCQGCHPDAYQAWRTSAHSRAKDALSPAAQKDARCLSCHSPSEADQRVTGISCENCHGGGQYYAARYVMKDPDLARLVGLADPSEKGCRTCHDASSPSLKPFDFVAKLKAIDHWTAAQAKKAEKAP